MMYIDTNIFIYAIENHPRYGKACKRILLDIEKKKLHACASILVLVEILGVLDKINKMLERAGKKKLDIRKNIDAVLSLPITWFDLNFFLIRRASEYKYSISGIDKIHVATMEVNSIKQVISADKDFDKVDIVKRIDPLSYKRR